MSSNTSSTQTEVLVVGASLAGLCAAYSAARSGARTLLIDAAPEVGAGPNPATLLMEPLWRRTVRRRLQGERHFGRGNGPVEVLREYVQLKTVWVELSGEIRDPFSSSEVAKTVRASRRKERTNVITPLFAYGGSRG